MNYMQVRNLAEQFDLELTTGHPEKDKQNKSSMTALIFSPWTVGNYGCSMKFDGESMRLTDYWINGEKP